MSKRKGCTCEGHWRYRLANYVVTRRYVATVDGKEQPSNYCEVKCRQCRKKWRSKARYVDDLPDYRERRYHKLTDAQVLALLREGRIEVDLQTGQIRKQRRDQRGWLADWVTLKQTPCKDGYLFVDIKHHNHRKWVAVHRLVWMCYKNKLVPKGYDIDHRDHNRNNVAISNLRQRKMKNNRADQWRNHDDLSEVPF